MTEDIKAAISVTRTRFVEDLYSLGFKEEAAAHTYGGEITYANADGEPREEYLTVVVPEDFPYQRPLVFTNYGAEGLIWHRSPNQLVCLWPDDASVSDLPWSRAQAIVDRVTSLLERPSGSWPDEIPLPDLERYYPTLNNGFLFVFDGDSPEFQDGVWFECSSEKTSDNRVIRMGSYIKRPAVPSKKAKTRRDIYGFAVDIGVIDRPPASWDEFKSLADGIDWRFFELFVSMHLVVVLLRYSIAGMDGQVQGDLPILLQKGSNNTPVVIAGSLVPVPSGRATRTMRGGVTHSQLQAKSVAIVGCGAVGSFVADQLARGGIGRLALYDHDILRPGNSIRHLIADPDFELQNKADALKAFIGGYGFVDGDSIEAHCEKIDSLEKVRGLQDRFDVVVDATASGQASTLLAESAEAATPVVQAYLQREGGVIRIDIFPSDDHLDGIPDAEDTHPILVEAGCGDPVSPTPPHAVVLAASLATDAVINLLTASDEQRPTTLFVRAAQPDAPYDEIKVIQ